MNRRDALQALLASLAASSGVLPHPARTQPRMLSVVSVSGNSKESIAPTLAIFREALKTPGYIEGRNISFDLSAGEFSRDRTRQLAIEAMATKSDIIFAQHGAVHAFADLTKTIPIIAIYSGDMVEAKLVKSLAGPGGNITGVQLLGFDLVGKRIEILKELVPSIKHLWGGAVSRPNHAFARPACRSVHPAAEAAAGVGLVQLCRCGGARQLRSQPARGVAPRGQPLRSRRKRRCPGNAADRIADDFRTGPQSQDGPRAGREGPRIGDAARRPGD